MHPTLVYVSSILLWTGTAIQRCGSVLAVGRDLLQEAPREKLGATSSVVAAGEPGQENRCLGALNYLVQWKGRRPNDTRARIVWAPTPEDIIYCSCPTLLRTSFASL
jgi:hypothetical protein